MCVFVGFKKGSEPGMPPLTVLRYIVQLCVNVKQIDGLFKL